MDTTHAIAASAWLQHDSQLILACVLALATVVTLIAVLRIAPFFAILLGTFVAGAVAGLPMEKVAKAFSQGAGGLLGDVGVIIALGAMLGALMAESGAADRLVDAMLRRSTPRTLPWLMAGVAVIIGLPLFFEVGLVVMVPIIFVMARRANQPVLRIAIPALAGMTTLHALLPPHPGPLIAVSALHADLGMTRFCWVLSPQSRPSSSQARFTGCGWVRGSPRNAHAMESPTRRRWRLGQPLMVSMPRCRLLTRMHRGIVARVSVCR